jgi:hypothetical protein
MMAVLELIHVYRDRDAESSVGDSSRTIGTSMESLQIARLDDDQSNYQTQDPSSPLVSTPANQTALPRPMYNHVSVSMLVVAGMASAPALPTIPATSGTSKKRMAEVEPQEADNEDVLFGEGPKKRKTGKVRIIVVTELRYRKAHFVD